MTKCHLWKIRFQGTGLRWREATCWPESSCPPAPEGRGCLCSKETAHDLRPTHLVARSGEVQGRKLSPEIEADVEVNSPAHFQSNNYIPAREVSLQQCGKALALEAVVEGRIHEAGVVAEMQEGPRTNSLHYLSRALDRCLPLGSQTCRLNLPKPSLLLWQFCFSWGLVHTSNSASLKKKQFSLIPTNNRSEKV